MAIKAKNMKTIIIAGITRSGLTLTTQMLNAGGYPCVGEYPSFEKYDIGEIPFEDCKGLAIKVVDTHNQFPPPGDYHVIRLSRCYVEQSKSIVKFSQFFGLPITSSERKQILKGLPKDYVKIDKWAKRQDGFMSLNFEDIISNPETTALQLQKFVGIDLDIQKMIEVVFKRTIYCYDGMLELQMI